MIIGFQGIKNSYNDFATDIFIERLKIRDVEKIPLVISKNVAKSLIDKEIDFGVIAIKNNIAGIVKESENIMKSNLFQVVDTIEIKINHCLFVFDENSIKNLKTVASHPQALKQCENYINSYFPNCKLQEELDTSKTAEDLKNGILSKSTGVICSEKAGIENNLFLISKNIANKTSKTTFYLIKLK